MLVEGIEPRNHLIGKGDAFVTAEADIDSNANGKLQPTSSGSETVACLTLRLYGNLGDPVSAFIKESMPANRRGRTANQVQGVGWFHSTNESG